MASPSTDFTTMNKNTVRFNTWVGRVAYSHSYSYTFEAKRSGQSITSHKLECRIVGKSEKDYVLAVLKGSASEVESAKKKYVDGSVWVLAKVKLEENTSTALISTPLKLSVDLKKSALTVNSNSHIEKELAQSAVPPRTVSETSKITASRHQDLLAVITKEPQWRQTKRGEVCDITVMDGSTDAKGALAQIEIAVWGKAKQDMVSRHLGKPLVFLNLACKVAEGSKQYTSWEDSPLYTAPECEKGTKLQADAKSLGEAKNVAMLTKFNPKSSVDVSGPQDLSASAFLAYTAQNPSAKLPDVHQLMAVMLEEPTGSVTAEGTDRIWFMTKLREFSGSIDVSVSERVALKLTGLNAAAFKEAHADGSLQFPLLCNTRVRRSCSNSASQPGASQPGASQSSASETDASQSVFGTNAKTFVNHSLQDAEPFDWNSTVAPNAAYEPVLLMLNALPRNEDGLLFGFLADIGPDPYAGFQLVFPNGTTSKGAAVAVLVASHKKNKQPEPLGEGFKVCVPEVSDVANPVDAAAARHALTGYATLNDIAKFELTPARGRQQRMAIALITSCELTDTNDASQPAAKSFGMEKMQILEPGMEIQAVHVFKRLRRLTMRLNPANEDVPKSTLQVEHNTSSPLKKARTLSCMPTDESLKDTTL